MMKKNRIIALVAAVAIMLTAVPLAFAARGERRHAGFGEPGALLGVLHHVQEELDLTPAQKEQLRTIAREVREQNREYRKAMRGEMKGVAELLLANPNDISGAEALLDEQEQSRKAMRANVLAGVSRALNVLTPEQRSKLSEMLERHSGRLARF